MSCFFSALLDLGYPKTKVIQLIKTGKTDDMVVIDFGDDLQFSLRNTVSFSGQDILDYINQELGAIVNPEPSFSHLSKVFIGPDFVPYSSVASLSGSLMFPERPKDHPILLQAGIASREYMLQNHPAGDLFEVLVNEFRSHVTTFDVGEKRGYEALIDDHFNSELRRLTSKNVGLARDVASFLVGLSHGSDFPEKDNEIASLLFSPELERSITLDLSDSLVTIGGFEFQITSSNVLQIAKDMFSYAVNTGNVVDKTFIDSL